MRVALQWAALLAGLALLIPAIRSGGWLDVNLPYWNALVVAAIAAWAIGVFVVPRYWPRVSRDGSSGS